MTDRPTAEVEAAMRSIHGALLRVDPGAKLERRPIYHHWEDEELGVGPLYEVLTIALFAGGIRAYCRTSREGAAIEALFAAYYDDRDRLGARALIFDAADRAALRAAGLRGTSLWTGRWGPRQGSAAIAAFEALARTRPRVLLPEDLPPGSPWPWPSLIFEGLLAEVVKVEVDGSRRTLETIVDGERSRLGLRDGDRWDALWRWWQANPPALRTHAEWRRGRMGVDE